MLIRFRHRLTLLDIEMKLPNHRNAVIPERKITEYLLSETHPDGMHKAAFFTRFGYSLDQWQQLAADLFLHASDHEVTKEEDSAFGKRYVVDGIMTVIDGRSPLVRSIWFIETNTDTPRFVTAYPLRRKEHD